MQVSKIKAYIQLYLAWQPTETAAAYLPYWETQQCWQQHFDLRAPDFAAAYAAALDSKTNRRHFSRSAYEPKQAFLELIQWEPELIKVGFEDLFQESRSLDGRLQRFVLYCDELLTQYRRAKPDTKLATHYHADDYHMATLYLSCQYPALYAPYSTALLQNCLRQLGAADPPSVADVPRFMKLLTTLRRFLIAEPLVLQQYEAFLRPQDYTEESALLVWHFMQFVAQAPPLGR